ncbi:MAG: GNAT family N-acetyltransferase [Candidatus Cyclobacteriaceae bacterium M2_1C_046]
MTYREAQIDDIWQLHNIRNKVKENILSDPTLVLYEDYEDYLTQRGKGFVCEVENTVIGFAVADILEKNIWALFILPEFEKKGIGRALHTLLLDWYFSQTQENVWLSTEPHTRAAEFYKRAGWREAGKYGKKEVKFEMTYSDWVILKNKVRPK